MHTFRWSVVALLVVLGSVIGGATTAVAAEWQAGVAKVVITPKSYMWMSGYAGRNKPAEGKVHELWAKAVVLQDPAGEKLVLITTDLVGIPRDLALAVCTEIERKHQLPHSRVAINTSHTHCGPVVRDNLMSMYSLDETQALLVREYSVALKQNLVSVVGAAIKDLAPAKISSGSGTSTVAVNRRANKEPDVPKLREEGLLKGPVDHDVPVLAVHGTDGKLRAVCFGYACHATTLSFYEWCGDWPGFAQIELEKEHPGAVALFWAGCGADQNPLPRRTVELAEKYGLDVAHSVEGVLKKSLAPVTGKLAANYREIPLAFGKVPTLDELKETTNSTNKYEAIRAKMLLANAADGKPVPTTYPYPVQVWQIGNEVTWVLLGGEVVVDYALRIKKELGPKRTWVAGYSNDVMAYIPSLRVLQEGGYEGASSMVYYGQPSVWSTQVEEAILEAVHALNKSKP